MPDASRSSGTPHDLLRDCPRDMPESVSVHHALFKPLCSASGRFRQLLLEIGGCRCHDGAARPMPHACCSLWRFRTVCATPGLFEKETPYHLMLT